MNDATQYQDFLSKKKRFFEQTLSIEDLSSPTNQWDYRFLLKHHSGIEQEFSHILASLNDSPEHFTLYAYYCCIMLKNYYKAYEKQEKVDEYERHANQLQCRLNKLPIPAEETLSLKQKISADLSKLATTPLHVGRISDWLAFSNVYRIHFLFCRLSVRQSILLAEKLQWLEKLDALLGTHTDVKHMVSMINAPTPIFNVLSVGLFAGRFIINAGLIIKHVAFPSEVAASTTLSERLRNELYERHCVMLNDFAWGTVNLLANFNLLSAPVANWLTAGFLCFDVALLCYRRYLAQQEYLSKKDQYEQEQVDLLSNNLQLNNDYLFLGKQLEQLEINWKKTNSTFYFNITAAGILAAGFSASLLFTMPAAIVASYFVCMIGVAMYLSADTFGNYLGKKAAYESSKSSQALVEMQSAKKDFFVTMAKNTTIPLFLVTTYAISWPASIILAAVYIGYECTHGYFTTASSNKNTISSKSSNDESIEEEWIDETSKCNLR